MNPLLLAGATAGITYLFTRRQWKTDEKFDWKKDDLTDSKDLLRNLCKLIDARVYTMRRVAAALQAGHENCLVEQRWQEYQEILNKWYPERNVNLIAVNHAFGSQNCSTLNAIFNRFDELHDQLMAKDNTQDEQDKDTTAWDAWQDAMDTVKKDAQKMYSSMVLCLYKQGYEITDQVDINREDDEACKKRIRQKYRERDTGR